MNVYDNDDDDDNSSSSNSIQFNSIQWVFINVQT
jgi:hypothetical protein